MLNHVTMMGRLCADPELRTTQNGVPVGSFRIAVERDFAGRAEERETDFFDVTVWRGTAEFVSKYFTKGRMAVVEGRLQIRQYTDRDGNKRTAAEVVADNVYFGDSKKDDSGDGYRGGDCGSGASGAGAGEESKFEELADDDGDLPF